MPEKQPLIEIEYELTLQGENKMNLSEYLEASQEDDNTFWRLTSGQHLNLLNEAIELYETATEALKSLAVIAEPIYRMQDMPKETLQTGNVTTEIALAYQDVVPKELVVTLSCGSQLKIPIDIPDHDVPCPCGNPNHWLVKHYPTHVPETDFGKDSEVTK